MALFITSNASISVVGASEIENKESINNGVKIESFYPSYTNSAAITNNGDLYCWG